MSIQIIKENGKPKWAVLPYEELLRLLDEAEVSQDTRDYDSAKKSIDQGEELIPSDVVYAILDGSHPVKVWREYRRMSPKQLAHAANLSESTLLKIEEGKRKATPKMLQAIAKALNLEVEDLAELEQP